MLISDRPPLAILQLTAALDGAADLSFLRRNLFINSTAALTLMASLLVIATRLKSYRQGRRLEAEVDAARLVQHELLPPRTMTSDHLDMTAHYAPMSAVGGDFYDTFEIGAGKTALILGDVSGKGVPAALLMGVLEGAVRSGDWAKSAEDHEAATKRLNALLCERAARERFATMFWSYFDSRDMSLRYINAGHCPPLLFRAATLEIERLDDGGPVLGMLPQVQHRQVCVAVAEGDLLVLYSDGICEAGNAAGDEFGEDRLRHVVELYQDQPGEEIRDAILKAVAAFTGKQPVDDDRTLLIVRFEGERK